MLIKSFFRFRNLGVTEVFPVSKVIKVTEVSPVSEVIESYGGYGICGFGETSFVSFGGFALKVGLGFA